MGHDLSYEKWYFTGRYKFAGPNLSVEVAYNTVRYRYGIHLSMFRETETHYEWVGERNFDFYEAQPVYIYSCSKVDWSPEVHYE